MMRVRFLELAAALFLVVWLRGAAACATSTQRVPYFDEARILAKQSGKDIVIFQRGSDWNRLGEALLAGVWNKEEFARAVGDSVILVVIDQPENPGAPPVEGRPLADQEPPRPRNIVDPDTQAIKNAEAGIKRNNGFRWRGVHVPRVAFLDSEGRPIACENKLRLGLTPAALAKQVKEMQSLRQERDRLWEQAAKAEGPAKAELLKQGIQAMRLNMSRSEMASIGYGFVFDQMKAADPEDESGCLRWLQFSPDPPATPEFVNKSIYSLAKAKQFDEALAAVDRELKHPANRHLDSRNMQQLLLAKFHVFRSWPGHEEQQFDVLREMAALDDTTYLGIGAAGYLAASYETPAPVALLYGWVPKQVKAGNQKWELHMDLHKHFDHPGPYTFRLCHNGGKDGLTVNRVTMREGDRVLAVASPQQPLVPGGTVDVVLDIKPWRHDRDRVLHLDIEAAPGKTDVAGRFEVEPLLVE